jgi:hypothetical protein
VANETTVQMLKRHLLLLSVVALSCPALAQERVHSDLPLFSGKNEKIWPQGFVDKDSWGCASRVAFGDWKYLESRENADPDVEWLRLRNYGVFHCAVIEEWAYDRKQLGRRGIKYSWFVELGQATRAGSKIELWALQSGSRPGSDYLLLARTPAAGPVKRFEVLPVECPPEYERKGHGPDIWSGDYCAINSASELRSFARKMANRPIVGTLTYVDKVPENAEADD